MVTLSPSDLQSKAGDLVAREVQVCLSSLVSTLSKGYGESSEAYNPDLADLAEQAFELACSIPDYEEAAIQAGWSKRAIGPRPDGVLYGWFRSATPGEIVAGDFEEASSGDTLPHRVADTAEGACELDGIEPYDREVYEHWAVSTWLGEKLAAAGEKVDDDFAGMVVWARTTTGQGIYGDAVIERITADLFA